MEIPVRNNNVQQAERVLKKKMQIEGILRDLRRKERYKKDSVEKKLRKAESKRRIFKAERKRLNELMGIITPPKTRRAPRRRMGA